jgi:hypothetical protein
VASNRRFARESRWVIVLTFGHALASHRGALALSTELRIRDPERGCSARCRSSSFLRSEIISDAAISAVAAVGRCLCGTPSEMLHSARLRSRR